jgi:hypothetical protein
MLETTKHIWRGALSTQWTKGQNAHVNRRPAKHDETGQNWRHGGHCPQMSISVETNTELHLMPTPRFRCQSPARAGHCRTLDVYNDASPAMFSPAKDAETVQSTICQKRKIKSTTAVVSLVSRIALFCTLTAVRTNPMKPYLFQNPI